MLKNSQQIGIFFSQNQKVWRFKTIKIDTFKTKIKHVRNTTVLYSTGTK